MTFRIKNITKWDVSVFGSTLGPKEDVDLTVNFTNAQIRASLLTGELYHKIQGRMLAVLSPPEDWNNLGLSTGEFSRLTHAGFFQGFLGIEELKPPFTFDGYGNLNTNSVVNLSGVTVSTEIRGDNPVVADRDNVLIAGTDTGAKGGTVRFGKIDASNQLAVYDASANTSLSNIDTSTSSINTKLPSQGQATMANSLPVVIASDQSAFSVSFDNTQTDGYDNERLANATNVAINTYDYYVDMQGWRFLGIFIDFGADTTGKIYGSGEFEADAGGSVSSWTDMTDYLFGVATLPANDIHLLNLDTPFPFRWVRIEVTVTAGTNSHDIWATKLKAF